MINKKPLVTVTLFGPNKDMEYSIEKTVSEFVKIYHYTLQEYSMNNFFNY